MLLIFSLFCHLLVMSDTNRSFLIMGDLCLKPLSHKTMKSTRLYTKLGFPTPCRLHGCLCRLHDKTGTLPETSCSLQDKSCSLHVHAEIFWPFKNFHEVHMKFDLDIHCVNFMLTLCTLRGIQVDYWLTSCYFVFTSYPNSNTK